MLSPITGVVFGAAVVGTGLAAISFRTRRIPGTRWFALMMVGVALWAGAAGMQSVVDGDVVPTWHAAMYVGVVV
ncbi:histidine kinase N-terminal 7TM domain-containing protein, partial [Halobium palmae]